MTETLSEKLLKAEFTTNKTTKCGVRETRFPELHKEKWT